MKKFLAILLAVVLCFALVACGGNTDENADATSGDNTSDTSNETVDVSKLKIGVVLLHNETVGYDKNFIEAIERTVEQLGLNEDQIVWRKDTPEDSKCYENCVDLAEQGCNIIFADSFGHEENVIKAAKEYENIQFFHATGQMAKIENLPNFHNAFASIYEGRYLAGVVGGLKLNELIDSGKITADQAQVGYIGAFPYAEVISGYTSFFLGVRSVCESAKMEVVYTNSWADESKEKEAATKLIEDGCVLISEHADTFGSPNACEEAASKGKTVVHVGYNIDFTSAAPTTNLISSKIDWTPYFVDAFTKVAKGEAVDADWCGDLSTGSVLLTEANKATVTDEMLAKVEEVKADIEAGKIKVFDVQSFTVTPDSEANKFVKCEVDADGHLTSFTADAVADADYTPDTESVIDGEVAESTHRSAPYFNIIIDGITTK
ncbi:MAG: BMP family ABC transporter substrate-binding protein [Faecalibacterium sp.]|nr:BMP family ABC transporter substrate-binding protein [Ruminococcus sp.]MCM1391733.1 BMP family ABC transporter substrate-binding protein [Ruminococcus sp.]MCM1485354.1 BMP family ABC transporter substrate-binding protein [Faecalibacterium sp.]